VCAHTHSLLLSASECLESLRKKEEVAGLGIKTCLSTSLILWLQILVIASHHCESPITWCSVDKRENPNHTPTPGHLCHSEKLWRYTWSRSTERGAQVHVSRNRLQNKNIL